MWGCCRLAVVSISRRNRSAPMHGGQLGAQHLEGHRSVVLQVAGEEDGRHPARAQFALQRIAVA